MISFLIKTLYPIVFLEAISHQNRSPRTRPQNFLVTHYDCEENQQKTLHKYAINQVAQFEYEPQDIKPTTIVATIYSTAPASTLMGYKNTVKLSEKKYIVHKFQTSKKNRHDHESS